MDQLGHLNPVSPDPDAARGVQVTELPPRERCSCGAFLKVRWFYPLLMGRCPEWTPLPRGCALSRFTSQGEGVLWVHVGDNTVFVLERLLGDNSSLIDGGLF